MDVFKVSDAAVIQMAMTVKALLGDNLDSAEHMGNIGIKIGVMAR